MLKIAIFGAAGRMGRTLVRCIAESDDLEFCGGVVEAGDAALEQDAGEVAGTDTIGIALTDDPGRAIQDAHVAIDFTLPGALTANLAACVAQSTPLVMGTTGLEERQQRQLREASAQIPLVYGRNMSVGVNVFMELVRRAAEALDADYDAEISEAHHRHKVDSPSGTALALGEIVARARGGDLADLAVYGREGAVGPRASGVIGFSVVRAGAIVGEHTVLFGSDEERLELTHRAADRAVFAKGALRAARWVAGRAPGFYGMADVLGFDAPS